MVARILTYHQVLPDYLLFLFAFGAQVDAHNTRHSGFREQTTLKKAIPITQPDGLGRSNRQFKLCYNLKSVTCTSPDTTSIENRQWAVRQGALCHQLDIVTGNALWILTKAGLDLKRQIQGMTGPAGRREDHTFGTIPACLQSSLAVHLLLANWASDGWSAYIEWLEEVVELEVSNLMQESLWSRRLIREN
jgi:hypothetical protein